MLHRFLSVLLALLLAIQPAALAMAESRDLKLDIKTGGLLGTETSIRG